MAATAQTTANAPAPQTDAGHELAVLLRSRVPLIVIETHEEARALTLLATLAVKVARSGHTPMFQWTVTDGLRRLDLDLGTPDRTKDEPLEVLKHIRATHVAGVYVLVDFHPFLNDPKHVRLIKDICLEYGRAARTLVLLSHELQLPRELEAFSARFELAMPGREERRELIEGIAREWVGANPGSRVKADRHALELLVENMSGLTTADTARLARKAIFDDGALSGADLPALMQAKYQLLNRAGVLSYEHD
ncbi:MAG TPA: hypothetical protein VFR59_09215, partial [Steroidobacteraceae bacterium]|nr:hypothetical protein [Steroidobacteraceae bacterium]